MTDNVNHPSHYVGRNGLEAVDVLKEFLTPEEFMAGVKETHLSTCCVPGGKMMFVRTWRKRRRCACFFRKSLARFIWTSSLKEYPWV
nr:DUF3310 domain-containing protein [Corynebacterium ulcerans]